MVLDHSTWKTVKISFLTQYKGRPMLHHFLKPWPAPSFLESLLTGLNPLPPKTRSGKTNLFLFCGHSVTSRSQMFL